MVEASGMKRLRAKERFGILSRGSKSVSRRERQIFADRVQELSRSYSRRVDNEVPADTFELQRAFTIIVETISDCERVLGISIPFVNVVPFYGEDSELCGRVRVYGQHLLLQLNTSYVLHLAQSFQDKQLPFADKEVNMLRETTAHEAYHIKQHRDFPQSARQTREANSMGGEAYWRDRGETAARLFAASYFLYKKEHESHPALFKNL